VNKSDKQGANNRIMKSLSIVFFLVVLFCASAAAQTTAFTFQGSMQTSGSPANGNFDFDFKLFDLVSAGAQQGSTIQRLNVAVANGIFTVSLDFGAGTLPGADRFLEIAVRTAGGPLFTPLSPRQKVNSSPYSVRSLNSTTATNATQLGGVAASQYVVTTDPRMTDARDPLPGSNNYIRNSGAQQQAGANFWISGSGNFGGSGNFDGGLSVGGNFIVGGNTTLIGNLTVNGTLTGNLPSGDADYVQNRTTTQASTNFNISGTGNANIFNASTQFNLGGSRVLTVVPASSNTFVGITAGQSITTGFSNSFFGHGAGASNLNGPGNSFFGENAGQANTVGTSNAFFGAGAGEANLSGGSNSFFGTQAGRLSTGSSNSFFGSQAGYINTTGSDNVFLGRQAGNSNVSGSNNTIIGKGADVASGNLSYSTAIGADAVATLSDSIYLGRPGGEDAVRIPGSVLIDRTLVVDLMGSTTGNVHLCLNTSNRLSLCTSNLTEAALNDEFRLSLLKQQEQIEKQQALIEQLTKRLEQLEKKEN